MFCSYVISAPAQTSFKVPILVKNESAHAIKVPASQTMAELSIPLSISPIPSSVGQDPDEGKAPKSTMTTTVCNNIRSPDSARNHPLQFDFSDSPLSEEWKKRVTERLNPMSDVFATHDLDYGHTTAYPALYTTFRSHRYRRGADKTRLP